MYLHDDRELFREVVERVAADTNRAAVVVEKDYYVTMILKLLSNQLSNVVFKGGTSLSKGYRVINRFSEDIDITFDEHIGKARRKKLKYAVLMGISEELNMPISNWCNIQSDRDYNAYCFSYHSVFSLDDDKILSSVKLETALGSYAFPTECVELSSYIGDYLIGAGRSDLVQDYDLNGFSMKLQSLERTFIDKIFALCDYFIYGKSKRYSRHMYDIYKLSNLINIDSSFIELFEQIRKHRQGMSICPSAREEMCLTELIKSFCSEDFYKEDYHTITSYFSDDNVPYEEAKKQLLVLAKKLNEYGIT